MGEQSHHCQGILDWSDFGPIRAKGEWESQHKASEALSAQLLLGCRLLGPAGLLTATHSPLEHLWSTDHGLRIAILMYLIRMTEDCKYRMQCCVVMDEILGSDLYIILPIFVSSAHNNFLDAIQLVSGHLWKFIL